MKKYIVLTAALVLTAGSALGYLGQVYASWPAPSATPTAVARSGNLVYVFCASGRGMIYIMHDLTGSISGSYTAVAGTQCRGLAFSQPGSLWQGKISYPYRVYDTAWNTGSIYRSWALNNTYQRGIAPLCTGDGGAGTTRILTCDYSARRIYERRLDTGSVYRSFVFSSSAQMYDIAWDWRNGLLWGGMNAPYIYGVTRTGLLAASFPAPAGLPYGIAYSNNFLHIATGSDNRIWRVHCPATVGVEPASMGRIKAAFR